MTATGTVGARYVVIALFLVFIAVAVVFVFVHLRPLNDDELESLAAKRRTRQIKLYFAFSNSLAGPDLDFKRRMAAGGQFYNIRDGLPRFPHRAPSWLKYKKHEWFVVGMERNRKITLVWLNKGQDGTRVCLALPFERLA